MKLRKIGNYWKYFFKAMFPDWLPPIYMSFTNQQFPLVWKPLAGLASLTSHWSKFLAINSDGQTHDYNTRNILDQDRKIYFYSNVAHLLKTTANNTEYFHGNINWRNLMVIHFYWFFLHFSYNSYIFTIFSYVRFSWFLIIAEVTWIIPDVLMVAINEWKCMHVGV